MQKGNITFRLLTDMQSDWCLTGKLNASQTGKLVILDNTGNLISRQMVKLVKGENNIPVCKDTFSNGQMHVIILYVGNDVAFTHVVMNKLFLH